MKLGIDIPNFGHWADPRYVAEFAREIAHVVGRSVVENLTESSPPC